MVWALDLTIALCKSCHVVLRFGVKKRAFGLSVPTGRRHSRSHVRRIEWLVLAFSLGAGCRHLLGENDLDLEELDDITWLAPGSTVAPAQKFEAALGVDARMQPNRQRRPGIAGDRLVCDSLMAGSSPDLIHARTLSTSTLCLSATCLGVSINARVFIAALWRPGFGPCPLAFRRGEGGCEGAAAL